jgi:hypothetical protein
MDLVRSLSATMLLLSRRAISRSRPESTESEVNLRFVALHYGQDLADRLERYLAARNPE